MPTPRYRASFLMISSKWLRCFSLSFLESSRPCATKWSGRITAAATTGPAKHPRPASSKPTTLDRGMLASKSAISSLRKREPCTFNVFLGHGFIANIIRADCNLRVYARIGKGPEFRTNPAVYIYLYRCRIASSCMAFLCLYRIYHHCIAACHGHCFFSVRGEEQPR